MSSTEKEERLLDILKSYGSGAVAFSGGVDSTYLLVMARQALGERAVAITARSPSFPKRESREAEAFCRQQGIRHLFVTPGELELEAYVANPPDRCYICKRHLFLAMQQLAEQEGMACLMEGTNASDAGDYRPGMRALAELSVQSPLREVGMTKADVRFCSKQRGIPTADKPSFACLATRIPYGEPITGEKLAMIEAAEEVLRAEGFEQYRVRLHGKDLARIEVPWEEIHRFAKGGLRLRVEKAFADIGFLYTALDLGGYRTGSLNRGLKGKTSDEKTIS